MQMLLYHLLGDLNTFVSIARDKNTCIIQKHNSLLEALIYLFIVNKFRPCIHFSWDVNTFVSLALWYQYSCITNTLNS